eukprot:Skav207160  [mRNA]  locus=scaffold573:404698:408451:+ [translate_table: standard]
MVGSPGDIANPVSMAVGEARILFTPDLVLKSPDLHRVVAATRGQANGAQGHAVAPVADWSPIHRLGTARMRLHHTPSPLAIRW